MPEVKIIVISAIFLSLKYLSEVISMSSDVALIPAKTPVPNATISKIEKNLPRLLCIVLLNFYMQEKHHKAF